MDEWGVRLPLIFKAFGDYKLPVYIYLTAIPVWFFGLNAFAVRFISALAGTLAIPGIYLLTKQVTSKNGEEGGSDSLATITALLLAISPWHFFISRPALEANLALTFIIFGFYFLLLFLRSRNL
jgi:4-amino-4-deoxy-L-arabinose transferase-like glycosyltransferase